MAHHVAELVHAAEAATSKDDKRVAQDRAFDAIRQLWDQRARLPGHVDPLKRYEKAITCLQELSPDANPWRKHNTGKRRDQLALRINDALNDITAGTFLLEAVAEGPLSSENEELAASFLAPDDKTLLRMLEAKLASVAGESSEPADQDQTPEEGLEIQLPARLVKRIDEAISQLTELKRAILQPEMKPPEEPIDEL